MAAGHGRGGRTAAFLAAGFCAALPASAPAGLAAEAVDLELVIATDSSRSIDLAEAELQREGVAAAFASPEVIQAVEAGYLGRIAVAYIDFSSRVQNKVVVDWRVIGDRESATDFATALLEAELNFGMSTSISDAIELAARMIEANDIEGTRRVIDVSGDGPNNFGRLVDRVRDETVAREIAINGLPIMNPRDRYNTRYYLADLDRYFEGCVIGGPGAFVVIAEDFDDFARAIRRKLILEIAGRAPPATPRRAAIAPAQLGQSGGSTYEKGCDIGERMRGSSWGVYEP
ncbi:MAG: DUF1194 domain-containing protein [Kiloniellales bacterium]